MLAALSACGVRASLSPGDDSADAGTRGLPGNVGQPGAEAGVSNVGAFDAGTTTLNDHEDAAVTCLSGAIGALPLGDHSVSRLLSVSDPSASYDDVIALDVQVASSTYPAAITAGGAFGVLDTPSVNLSSLMRIGVALVYYVETTGQGSTLFSVSRQGGTPTVVLAANDATITDVEIVAGTVWLVVVNSSDQLGAIYQVTQASGGTLGTPFYAAPAGASITNLATTADGSLAWAEATSINPDASANVTVRVSPTGTTAAPTVLATFAASPSLQIASFGSLTYFAFPGPIGTPLIPPPPHGGGEDGGPSVLSNGLYSVSAGGVPTLIDEAAVLPLVPAPSALYFIDNQGIWALTPNGSLALQLSATNSIVAYGASAATGLLYYEMDDGCFYSK